MIDQNSRSFPSALDHVMGKRVYDEYIFSDALVKMGGPHPEEQQGQYLMCDRSTISVRQDLGFLTTIAFRMPSPFFRQQALVPVVPISNSARPAKQSLRRDLGPLEGGESEKESQSESDSES